MAYKPAPDLRLHPKGDIYGPNGFRLPEFQQTIRDPNGDEHPMRYIGRYGVCQIHHSALTQDMSLGTSSKPACTQAAQDWNAYFRLGDKRIRDIFQNHWATSLQADPAPYNSITRASILKEIRRYTKASYSTILKLVTTYPELYQDPTWLQEHQELDITAPILAIVKHYQVPDIIPLAKACPLPWEVIEEAMHECQQLCQRSPAEVIRLLQAKNEKRSWWPLLIDQHSLVNLLQHLYPASFDKFEGKNFDWQENMVKDDPSLSPADVDLLLYPWQQDNDQNIGATILMEEHLLAHQHYPSTAPIFAWQRVGHSPEVIEQELARILEADPDAWLPSNPPSAQPWQKELELEAREKGDVYNAQSGLANRITALAAPDNWWQGIPVESPEVESPETDIDTAVALA